MYTVSVKDPKKILPISDKILIKLDSTIKQTESGIFLPDTSGEVPCTGTILAISSLIDSDNIKDIHEGDRVAFVKGMQYDLVPENSFDDCRYCLVAWYDLLCVIGE